MLNSDEKPPLEAVGEESRGLDGAAETEPRPSISQQISTEALDDVNLEEVGPDDTSERSRSSTIRSSQSSRLAVPTLKEPPAISTGAGQAQGFRRPSMPWASSAQPPPVANASANAPPPPPRKLTSPFSWLSRNASVGNKEMASTTPPPATTTSTTSTHNAKRDTASSMTTIGSNPELMLNRIGDGPDADNPTEGAHRPGRNSLRDRFKMLRIREEAGIASLEEDEVTSPGAGGAIAALIGRGSGLGLGIGSPTSVADEPEGSSAAQGTARSPSAEVPSLPSVVNPQMAPGTASGISAGPSAMQDPAAPVDWDLWQSVVYEGPAAVARTSPEQLNRAIASGIPNAIRGVVWQVLAQSKNEELESVYRDLISRGTDKDKDRFSGSNKSNGTSAPTTKSEASAGQANGGKDKDLVSPSSSSHESGHSTPATTATNGRSTPTASQKEDTEAIAKLKANLLVEKRKKAAEDAASLQKLERAIKRDLGARTSYSKYLASAGLQDGLFAVCKAYALFDEGVGYAQGMNFMIMPLLFNVSRRLRRAARSQ